MAGDTNFSRSDAAAESIDDNISLTSTIDEDFDSDEEWPVNRILAEGKVDGEVRYLSEWAGFPLSSASWEPRSHFQEGLLEDWESTKKKQRSGVIPKFLISQWRNAVIDHWSAKFARHEARNRKRAAAGQSTTIWDQSIEDIIATLDEHPADEPEKIKDGPALSRDKNTPKTSQVSKIQEAHQRQQPESRLPEGLQRRHTTQATSSGPNISKRPPIQTLSVAEPRAEQRRHSLSAPRGRDKSVAMLARHRPPPAPGQTVNVFAGGKARNSVRNLLSAAADREKQPKMLRARFQRLIEKGQRDKEGTVAPPRMPNTLISLDPKNPGIVRRQSSVGDTVDSQTNVDEEGGDDAMDIDSTSSDDSDDIPIIQSRRAKEPSTNAKDKMQMVPNTDDTVDTDAANNDGSENVRIIQSRRPKESSPRTKNSKQIMPDLVKRQRQNRKKVVFWVNQDEANSTPIPDAGESSLFVADEKSRDEVSTMMIDHGDDESMTTIPQLNNLSLQSRKLEPSNQKSCRIGLHAKEPFMLTFEGVPTNGNLPELSDFFIQEELVFTHTCNAHDYQQQLTVGELVEIPLASGSVSMAGESDSFHYLVERLRLSSFGLLCHAAACCILLYPAKSEEWGRDGAVGTIGAAAASSSRICYSIFKPTARFTAKNLRQRAHTPLTTASSRTATGFFGQCAYETLLPLHQPQASAQQTVRDSFCLVFPPSAQQEADLLLQWLQLSNPNSDLRCSLVPGHWRSFLKRSYGTVILHEDTLGSIYRMPSISTLLHTRGDHYSFWVLRRPLSRLSVPLSIALPSMDRSGFVLERIFRPGIAILVSPSFLLSQPKQAYNFFKWFWQNFSSTAHVYRRGRLVMCANIADWLLTLALQRAHEPGTNESDASIEIRFKSAALVRSLTAESADSPSCPIVCAPEHIDGHDEQSLVNWFGWWSLTQADCFRKFSFLCSDNDCQESLTRVISPPVFNEVSLKTQLLMRSENSKPPELVPDDTAGNLLRYIENIEYRVLSASYWKPVLLYRFPVAQKDHAVETRAYTYYGSWVQYYLSRVLPKVMQTTKLGGGVKTTFVGLFHTKGSASGTNIMQSSGSRQPWIAILRPADLNRRPLKSLELLIWDVRIKEKAKSVESIASADLCAPQQELIDQVAAMTEGSQDCLPLKRVWVGGFKSSHRLSHPVDKTLDFLEALLSNYKDWLPFDPDNLEGRGWRHVSQSIRPASSYGLANDRGTDEQDVQRMVFDPPTPSSNIPPQKCKNRLCQWALDNPAGKDATFTFVPTMEWYKEQVDAGYGYEHVKAVGWKAFFELYKIADPDDGPAKTN